MTSSKHEFQDYIYHANQDSIEAIAISKTKLQHQSSMQVGIINRSSNLMQRFQNIYSLNESKILNQDLIKHWLSQIRITSCRITRIPTKFRNGLWTKARLPIRSNEWLNRHNSKSAGRSWVKSSTSEHWCGMRSAWMAHDRVEIGKIMQAWRHTKVRAEP